jgi:hypothetical protein
LNQCRFARTRMPDYADKLAFVNRYRDILYSCFLKRCAYAIGIG